MATAWQPYIQKLLNTTEVAEAAILGITGTGLKLYTSSPTFELKSRPQPIHDQDGNEVTVDIDELSVLQDVLNNGAGSKYNGGIWLNGQKYTLVSWDEESGVGYFKCRDGGAVIKKTKTCIIIGTFDSGKFPNQTGGKLNIVVEKLGDDFIKVNY